MTDANQEYSLGGFGARLKAARESMNLSQKEAATRLHLNPNIVQILESENFQKAPPATFMRGYLRSYARLLNFNEEDITAALMQSGLEAQTRTPVVPILPGESMQMTDQYVQWISTTAIIGLFVFVGIWWGFHSASNKNTLVHSTAPLTIAPQPAPTKTVQTQPVQPQPMQAQPVPTTAVVTPTQPPAPVVATPPTTVTTANPAQTQTTQTPPTAPPAIVAQPTTPPSPVNPPSAVANTNPPATTGPVTGSPAVTANGLLPPIPGTAITPVPANSAVASDTPKKRNRHHKQDSNVSGFAMALPEPGL